MHPMITRRVTNAAPHQATDRRARFAPEWSFCASSIAVRLERAPQRRKPSRERSRPPMRTPVPGIFADPGLAASVAVSPDGSTVYVTGTSGARPAEGVAYTRIVTIAYCAATGSQLWQAHYGARKTEQQRGGPRGQPGCVHRVRDRHQRKAAYQLPRDGRLQRLARPSGSDFRIACISAASWARQRPSEPPRPAAPTAAAGVPARPARARVLPRTP
jgi:hypothetical protein